MPTFDILKAYAEAGVCSLCTLLWTAIKSETEKTQPAEDSIMEYPVRLCLDGVMKSFAMERVDKILKRGKQSSKSPEVCSNYDLYSLMTSKAPAMIDICALEPDNSFKSGFCNTLQDRVSFYREPGKSQRLSILGIQGDL